MKYIIIILLFVPQFIFSQVGIGTTTPQETLEVNGSFRVTDTNKSPATKLMGAEDQGTLSEVEVGSNLELNSGVLNATGSNKYFVQTIPITTTSAGQEFHNLNLDLEGVNKDKTVFRLSGASHNFTFTGIDGGTAGRHIVLVNVTSNNFRIADQDSNSLAANRVITLSGGFEATSGQGAAELVYDEVLARWIVLNFRN